jgi:hypothetical protein
LFSLSSSSTESITTTQFLLREGFAVELTPKSRIPAGGLIELRQLGTPIPPRPKGAHLVLANGDMIPGELLNSEGLTFTWSAQLAAKERANLTFPFPALAQVWFVSPPGKETRERISKPNADLLLLKNRDLRAGSIEKLISPDKSVQFRAKDDTKPSSVAITDLLGLVRDPTLVRLRAPRTPYARVTLRNGTRISVKNATYDGKLFTLTHVSGSTFLLPLEELLLLQIVNGKAKPLTELTPFEQKVEPFSQLTWPWQSNQNVRQEPMTLRTPWGIETIDSGLGTHSRTKLTYRLEGKYRRFEALVGLDAEYGKKGAAAVTILLDGKALPLPELAKLSAENEAIRVSVDVSRTRELSLLIDFGPGGDVQDVVNWGDARLIE